MIFLVPQGFSFHSPLWNFPQTFHRHFGRKFPREFSTGILSTFHNPCGEELRVKMRDPHSPISTLHSKITAEN
jgi:hypothetical protein